ncbi:MAG: hypothetical protein WAW13_00570 [Minisyncoccia bacterium]
MSKLADELEGLAKDATAGPWNNHERRTIRSAGGPVIASVTNMACSSAYPLSETKSHIALAERDADLIVALRNRLPAILSALRSAGKMREALEGLYEACMAADERAELADEINGDLLDIARAALKTEGE